MGIAKLQVYKCDQCGNMVEVISAGSGSMACCNTAMRHLTENTTDAATEKHVPVITKVEGGYEVVVGEVNHPMEEKHLIEWIELTDDNGVAYRKFLRPGDEPKARFETDAQNVTVREHCNLHGLWKA